MYSRPEYPYITELSEILEGATFYEVEDSEDEDTVYECEIEISDIFNYIKYWKKYLNDI